MKEQAKSTVTSIEYWFRNKYKLSPKDPLFLNCEPWEIELEFEIDQLKRELARIPHEMLCPKCGQFFDGNKCPVCGHRARVERYFDPDFEEYFNEVLRSNEQFFGGLKWEEIKDDGVSGIGEG